jgi:hypothetical protein
MHDQFQSIFSTRRLGNAVTMTAGKSDTATTGEDTTVDPDLEPQS